jgi:hypothetical protein
MRVFVPPDICLHHMFPDRELTPYPYLPQSLPFPMGRASVFGLGSRATSP